MGSRRAPGSTDRNGWVTTYWWLIGMIGTRTPTIRAISAAYMPPASTTVSHSMSPWSVRTPVTAPPDTVQPSTRVRSCTWTPDRRAPFISA